MICRTTATLPRPLPRLGSRGAAQWLLSGAVLMALVGCNGATGRADRDSDDQIDQAVPKLSGTQQDVNDAATLLAKAAGAEDLSPPQKIRAKILQGQAEMQAGDMVQPQIAAAAESVRSLAWDIRSLGDQIAAHNALAAALQQNDPAALQDALKKNVSDVQGGADAPDWVKSDRGTVPSLASVTANTAKLQSTITDLQGQIKAINDQRNQLQMQADQLSQQSELKRGDESVGLFRQAADARKQSDDLSLKLDALNTQMSRAQADLAIQQGQQVVLNDAITTFGQQSDAAGKNWADVQKQIDAQREAARTLVGEDNTATDLTKDPTGGSTLSGKSATLAAQAQTLANLRDTALPHLNTALQCFKDAAAAADQFNRELGEKLSGPAGEGANAPAWRASQVTFNSARANLLAAEAQVRRAQLFAGQADIAKLRLDTAAAVKPALDAAQVSAPAGLQDANNKIADAQKDGAKDASEAYSAADEILTRLETGGTPPDQKKAAQLARLFTDYAWSLWATSQGDTGGAGDHLKAAQAERDALLQSGGTIRSLPPELAVITPAPPAAGATPGANAPAATTSPANPPQ